METIGISAKAGAAAASRSDTADGRRELGRGVNESVRLSVLEVATATTTCTACDGVCGASSGLAAAGAS